VFIVTQMVHPNCITCSYYHTSLFRLEYQTVRAKVTIKLSLCPSTVIQREHRYTSLTLNHSIMWRRLVSFMIQLL